MAFTQGTILANDNVDIVAQDPGDIVLEIAGMTFPVKALTSEKTVDVTPVYGTGSHQAYQKTYGKIGYKGSFTVNTWLSQEDKMKLDKAVYYEDDEGLPREFVISAYDRITGGAGGAHASAVILQLTYCTVSGDSVDIGEPGNPVARKYDYIALRRVPP
jgi:hypothetical protein